jgi:aminoglycoside/choline kinase family phosphotransferase
VQAAAPTLNTRLLTMFDRFEGQPLTIMHADWRLDNFFFGAGNSGYDFAVIDWQICNRGWGAYDVAYFIATNLEPEVRRVHGDTLLRAYHDALAAGGVRDYAFETLQSDFRLSVALVLGNYIGNLTSLDVTNERGVALFDLMLGRVAQAVVDVDALSAIE